MLLKDIEKHSNNSYCAKILVGTKIDFIDKRLVDRATAEAFATENQLFYFECSAKTGEGVNALFEFVTFVAKKTHDKDVTQRWGYKEIAAFCHAKLHFRIPTNNRTLLEFDIHKDYILEADYLAITSIVERNRKLASLVSDEKHGKALVESKLASPQSSSEVVSLVLSETSSPSLLDEKKPSVIRSQTTTKSVIRPITIETDTDVDMLMADFKSFLPRKDLSTTDHRTVISTDDETLTTELPKVNPMSTSSEESMDTTNLISWVEQLSATESKRLIATPSKQKVRVDDSQSTDDPLTQLMRLFSGADLFADTDTLKYICLSLQNKQYTTHKTLLTESTLSPTQAFIQRHPALRDYHDLFLQTLEFSIKAALLGITGHLAITNLNSAALGGLGGILGAVPGIGGFLKAPTVAMELVNQTKMRRQDYQISQLFKGARDVELQVAQLAEQMTLSIQDELLYGRRSSERQAVESKSGLRGWYQKGKNILSTKKAEYLNWQKLNTSQKQALHDAAYLFEQLPTLVHSRQFRDTVVTSDTYLQLLMHDPSFQYNATAAAKRIASSTEKPVEPGTPTVLEIRKQHHYQIKLQHASETLQTLAQQPWKPEQWPKLQTALEQWEVATLELEPLNDVDYTLHELLADWFDRTVTNYQTIQSMRCLTITAYLRRAYPTIGIT